ncbi:MAG: hypothetical protein LBE89_04080 [Helicobacteraceae bacterium]|nr:hypothetical protein [Helicobacteraceae bacterium]
MDKRVIVLLFFLLAGCNGRSAFFDFTGSATYAEALPHTKRGEIADRFESKALLSASHLNAIYPDNADYAADETFFIGLYIANDFSKDKVGINNPMFELTLDGKKYLSAKEVDKESEMLKLMPLINRWSRYYIVRFEKTAALKLTLTEHDTNRSVTLDFAP